MANKSWLGWKPTFEVGIAAGVIFMAVLLGTFIIGIEPRLAPIIIRLIFTTITSLLIMAIILSIFVSYSININRVAETPTLHDRIRSTRDELKTILDQLGGTVNQSQELLKLLDEDLNARDTKIAERRAELERLIKATEIRPEALEFVQGVLDERDMRANARSRKRDIKLLLLGGVIAAVFAIPGGWIAALAEPHIPFLPHQSPIPTPTVLPTPTVSTSIHR